MKATYFTNFRSPLGPCTLVWNEQGIAAVQLPEHSIEKNNARIFQQFSNAVKTKPSQVAAHAIDQLTGFLNGKITDFTSIKLDYSGISKFYIRVFEYTRLISFGTVTSYGELANQLGSPAASRAVGQALSRNRWPLVVPCHRVVAKSGNLTGFSAGCGIATKRHLLQIEGHVFNHQGFLPRSPKP